MKFKLFRSKPKGVKDEINGSTVGRKAPSFQARTGPDLTSTLPAPILDKIFGFVCPHARDDSYESCEQSALDGACMLCDVRDLAHCARTCRRWRKITNNVLYYSIRIDPVHYCEREDILAKNRKRGGFFDRNADVKDVTQQRLELLCRTLRDQNNSFATIVRFLKLPYQIREGRKADLARIVAVLPNLRYVDLPEGFYNDDLTCHPLREELHRRCPQIRKMRYGAGSEQSLEILSRYTFWPHLEVLELSGLNLGFAPIRYVLGGLSNLRALKISDLNHSDLLLKRSPDLPDFPPLAEFLMENCPNISIRGLIDYLSRKDVQSTIQTVSFTDSGLYPDHLHDILIRAPHLQNLSIIQSVDRSFPSHPQRPFLASFSLQTLHYEITAHTSPNHYENPATSHYAYLSQSLLANGLPNLRAVYVRDPEFADSLLVLRPPRAGFMGSGRPLSSNNPYAGAAGAASAASAASTSSRLSPSPPNQFLPRPGASPSASRKPNGKGLQHHLEVYTKPASTSLESREWSFNRISPHLSSSPNFSPRPLSAYGLSTGGGGGGTHLQNANWAGTFGGAALERGDVRRSVLVGNSEGGGFLAVPMPMEGNGTPQIGGSGEWPRPRSSASSRSRGEQWR